MTTPAIDQEIRSVRMTTHCAGRFMIRKTPWLRAVREAGCTALAGASTAVGGMDFTGPGVTCMNFTHIPWSIQQTLEILAPECHTGENV